MAGRRFEGRYASRRVVMCEACDRGEAQEFRQGEIKRVLDLPSRHEQVLAALRCHARTSGEDYEKYWYRDSGFPTFQDFREAGLPFATDHSYREVLNQIRVSSPKCSPPTNHVTLHVDVSPLFGSTIQRKWFDIGIFAAWIVSVPTSTSEYPEYCSAVLRADGALLALPFSGRDFVIGSAPSRTRPSSLGIPVLKNDRVSMKKAKRRAAQATADLTRFIAKPPHMEEVAPENSFVEHAMFRALFKLYQENYL